MDVAESLAIMDSIALAHPETLAQSIDWPYWFVLVLVSLVGLVVFNYGRKQKDAAPKYCGIGMMLVPYFIHSTLPLLAVCVLLGWLAWKFHDSL